jgi:calpain-7
VDNVEDQFYVLKKSSRINDLIFPLWNEPAGALRPLYVKVHQMLFYSPVENTRMLRNSDEQPKLSLEQLKVFPSWRRPTEIIPQHMMTSSLPLPHEIVQRVVTDCSVCSSISVCLAHHHRFGSKALLLLHVWTVVCFF